AALTSIEKKVDEASMLDGANTFVLHTKITIPMIAPTVFFVTLLSIVNSFKIFKESYLYYGTNYPPDHSYTLQYYMNNNFLKLDYQSLATSAVLTSILVFGIVMAGMAIQRRYNR
ncbi:MAG: sugar ABC transporter permease, partial [Oscillospiraceae bacterium]|nr:sugar ABC transporter permease [Oscillospiraceae bacterium]